MKSSHRRWTLDLFLVVAGSVAALAVLLLDVSGSVVRSLFVVPFIVLYPGYALMAAAFPERRSDVDSDTMPKKETLTRPTPHTAGLLYPVRLVLSAASSLAIVGGIALLTNFLGLGFSAINTSLGVFAVTMVLTASAFVRRAMLPAEVRSGLPPFSIAYSSAATAAGHIKSPLSTEPRDSPVPLLVNVLVVLSVVAFLSSVGFAMVETQNPESNFTEVYLVTENGSEYDASDYPRTLSQRDETPITLAIENHEHRTVTYTVVTEIQRLERTNNSSRVVEERELSRTERPVESGETAYLQRDVRPTLSGDSLRLVFFVYAGEAPDNPDRTSAYRTVQLMVDVGDDATGQSSRSQNTGGARS
ncbi:hypothetical protein C453_00285 [Haloferax elongans ATCC BAA-1513]|uniref:DUF1616 domain-containing protein n=1 Tax=Haloferax elongans ATCC BAA-1513 TaxID=1230453 RepID=M0I0I0_HALEO|nr:DUF1616 domain-containing protein [Haloferax elongans]ELZ89467.1 hypothetical protein C453_00285 [Haloferax elongans ATCC BAA-1513]